MGCDEAKMVSEPPQLVRTVAGGDFPTADGNTKGLEIAAGGRIGKQALKGRTQTAQRRVDVES